jgi:hypothetical protein
MLQTKFRAAYILSVIVTVLAAVASFGGILIGDLYRDNAFVKTAWYGNDLVTLIIVVPLLAAALLLVRRGSVRAQLVWLALLGYLAYNYAFYLFGATFNRFFLIYVAIFAMSGFALVLSLARVNAAAIKSSFRAATPARWIAGFMMLLAVILGSVELLQSFTFIASGQLPSTIVQTSHPTAVVFALDMSFIIPTMCLGSVLLWKRHPWGYILGTMLIIKGVTYGLVLLFTAGLLAGSGVWDALAPFYGFIFLGSLISTGFLFGNMHSSKKTAASGIPTRTPASAAR